MQRNSGIVDQKGRFAKVLLYAARKALYGGGHRDVDRIGPGGCRAQQPACLLQTGGVHVRQRELRATRRQLHRQRPADAGAGPGDHGDRSANFPHQ